MDRLRIIGSAAENEAAGTMLADIVVIAVAEESACAVTGAEHNPNKANVIFRVANRIFSISYGGSVRQSSGTFSQSGGSASVDNEQLLEVRDFQ